MQRDFTVKNKLGLHARPAALFVQTTGRFRSSVKVRKGDQEVDGKSIMGLMMLAAEDGCTVTIFANGPDEGDVLAALEKLFLNRFDEKE
jgi:phosphotransferase system HPr (HPr) family protein